MPPPSPAHPPLPMNGRLSGASKLSISTHCHNDKKLRESHYNHCALQTLNSARKNVFVLRLDLNTIKINYIHQEVMIVGAFVCLFVCVSEYSKDNEGILLKFVVWAGSDQGKEWLDF